ncbi:MAG: pyroglutamyl-peptidase I [Holophaga sp.]|nr:pyroglutamyl-peptidase I [Holophaga sp.]
MRRILVTGFGPFGGEPVNPALEAVRLLEGRVLAEHLLVTRELPVLGFEATATLVRHIQEVDPVLVIAIGQAGGRVEITPERVAINLDDYRIPDNGGNQPSGGPVVAGGPVGYWSRLPVKAMVQAMKEGGIPASVSSSAGTFVCNHVFYGLMHFLAGEGGGRRGGFIHVPYLPEQAARLGGQPSMGLETLVRGLEIAVAAAVRNPEDSAAVSGTIC